MEIFGLAILCFMLIGPIVLYLEKQRAKKPGPDRFEAAIAKVERKLSSLDGETLRERLRAHPYWRWIRGAAIADDVLGRVDRGEAQSIVDAWDRVTSALVSAERASGHSGPPRLIADEPELAALIRSIAKRDTIHRGGT